MAGYSWLWLLVQALATLHLLVFVICHHLSENNRTIVTNSLVSFCVLFTIVVPVISQLNSFVVYIKGILLCVLRIYSDLCCVGGFHG